MIPRQPDCSDDRSSDDQCRGETVSLELLALPSNGSLHIAHARQCRGMEDESLPQAPSVPFRYMYFLIGEEDIEEPDDPLLKRLRQWMRGMRIVGMCLANGHDCDNDKGVMPYTTYWGRPVGQRPAAIADPA